MAIAPALISLSCAGRIASVKISLGHVDHNVVGCICIFFGWVINQPSILCNQTCWCNYIIK
jgi:hypothetical protein